MKRSRSSEPQAGAQIENWPRRFAVGVMAWLVPVAILWIVLTPFYNRFLTTATENLVRLTESPSVTRLSVHERHYMVINRTDVQPAPDKAWLWSIRTTDTHFPLIMMAAFFLAVPGIGWKKRLENLGWAMLIAVFFHIVSLYFRVNFGYATQIPATVGDYGKVSRNLWGISSHMLELPFKFAMPFVLWAAFYIRHLLPATRKA